jgi:hypothetical protein
MKVNPLTFFNFCSGHVPLVRQLSENEGELSEAEVRRLIRAHQAASAELPETTWRRLRELQILVATEPGADFYTMAEPVKRLLDYLFDEAQAATPEMVRGYVDSLAISGRQLDRAMGAEDRSALQLTLEEISQTLRRIQADLEETHRRILNEVARYKTESRAISVREKFRRIVHWMERYVDPMVEIVRPDGALRATFDETERLLHQARENGYWNDLPAVERLLRYLRWVQRQGLRVFQQCRRELLPLYESLRRSSFIAAGAARALDKLQREGLTAWSSAELVVPCVLRWQHVPGDGALLHALRNVSAHRAEPAPVLSLANEEAAPVDLLRRLWLDGLTAEARVRLPVTDVLGWLVATHPQRNTADLLAGYTLLLFAPGMVVTFSAQPSREYRTPDGVLEATPVQLDALPSGSS